MHRRLCAHFVLKVVALMAFCGDVSAASIGIAPSNVVKPGTDRSAFDWLIAGPFVSTAETANAGMLRRSAPPLEGTARENLFAMLAELPDAPDARAPRALKPVLRKAVVRNAESIDFYRVLRLEPPSSGDEFFYAAAGLSAPRAFDTHALIGDDEGVEVWLNGSRIAAEARIHSVADPEYVVPLAIPAGENLLVLRIANLTLSAGFSFRLVDSRRRALEMAVTNGNDVPGTVHDAGGRLQVQIPAAIQPLSLSLKVVGDEGRPIIDRPDVVNGEFVEFSSATAPGLYRADLECEGVYWSEPVVVGDIAAIVEGYKERLARLAISARIDLNWRTLLRRMEILLAKENRQPGDPAWREKIRFTVSELHNCLVRLEKGEDPGKGTTGLHLRGFVSRIDASEQHYRIYVPRGYRADSPLPVVVMLPTVISANRPFIESAFVADHAGAMELGRIAEETGMAVLWTGYRCQPLGSPCEATHLDEILTDVALDYALDPHRLVLAGMCSGALLAEVAAIEFPERFAGLALLDGVFNRAWHRPDAGTLFGESAEYQQWRRGCDPMRGILLRKDAPIYVVHDGDREPGHGELENSLEFCAHAKELGTPILFQDLSSDPAYRSWRARQGLIEWAAKQRRESPSEKRRESPEPWARHGAVAEVFANRFVIVEGTAGAKLQTAAARRISAALQLAWQARHFGSCHVMTDEQFLIEPDAGANLVLIGNQQTNHVWQKYAATIDVAMAADGITVAKRRFDGSRLSVQAAFRESNGRRILVIGAHDLAAASFGTLDLSVDGWYDFAVWNPPSVRKRLAGAGRFE